MTTTGYRAPSSRRSCSASDSEAETTAAAQAPPMFFWRATPFSSKENGVAYWANNPSVGCAASSLYTRERVYLSQLGSATLMSRAEGEGAY